MLHNAVACCIWDHLATLEYLLLRVVDVHDSRRRQPMGNENSKSWREMHQEIVKEQASSSGTGQQKGRACLRCCKLLHKPVAA
eukprot:SAG31_NODE_374_length_16577_cov_9.902173_9_plen_83_part_00